MTVRHLSNQLVEVDWVEHWRGLQRARVAQANGNQRHDFWDRRAPGFALAMQDRTDDFVRFIDPWLDEKKLLGGQDWDLEIRRALRRSDAVVICLSQRSISKVGYVNKEIKRALDIADEQ